jgi:hypothetical protein
MRIIIGLASSQIMFTIVAIAIVLWHNRQLRLLRDDMSSLHKEVVRLKIRSDIKKR